MEASYADHTRFDAAEYAWKESRQYDAALQGLLLLPICEGADFWVEMDLLYTLNTYTETGELEFENKIGAQFHPGNWEARIFIMPSAVSVQSAQTDQKLMFTLGFDLSVRFF